MDVYAALIISVYRQFSAAELDYLAVLWSASLAEAATDTPTLYPIAMNPRDVSHLQGFGFLTEDSRITPQGSRFVAALMPYHDFFTASHELSLPDGGMSAEF